MYEYAVRVRISDHVTTVTVSASNASHAKEIAQSMYGPEATILRTDRI